MKKSCNVLIINVIILFSVYACSKDVPATGDSTGSLYVPTSADVTVNASLSELQLGRILYVNNCGSCHGLYSPDSYSASSWSAIVTNMSPTAGLSSANAALVLKYVTRGK